MNELFINATRMNLKINIMHNKGKCKLHDQIYIKF